MRETRKVLESYEATQIVRITCDLCGRENTRKDSENWCEAEFKKEQVEICYTTGSTYPEGGTVTRHWVDVCPECWASKVVPWLNEQGATLQTKEFDW